MLAGQVTDTDADSREDESARRALIAAMAISSSGQPPKSESSPVQLSRPQPPAVQYQVVGVGDVGLLLRPEPSILLDAIKTLPDGALVISLGPDVTGVDRTWRHVRDSEGIEGWLAAEYTRPMPSAQVQQSPR